MIQKRGGRNNRSRHSRIKVDNCCFGVQKGYEDMDHLLCSCFLMLGEEHTTDLTSHVIPLGCAVSPQIWTAGSIHEGLKLWARICFFMVKLDHFWDSDSVMLSKHQEKLKKKSRQPIVDEFPCVQLKSFFTTVYTSG